MWHEKPVVEFASRKWCWIAPAITATTSKKDTKQTAYKSNKYTKHVLYKNHYTKHVLYQKRIQQMFCMNKIIQNKQVYETQVLYTFCFCTLFWVHWIFWVVNVCVCQAVIVLHLLRVFVTSRSLSCSWTYYQFPVGIGHTRALLHIR